MKEIINEIKKHEYGKILSDVSLKDYTTYKVGGICRLFDYLKRIKLSIWF